MDAQRVEHNFHTTVVILAILITFVLILLHVKTTGQAARVAFLNMIGLASMYIGLFRGSSLPYFHETD